jgi:glycosyltransferase involved in cell wall biosynthesis
VGGIETLAATLIPRWIDAGHKVTVVTDVPNDDSRSVQSACCVLHRPSAARLFREVCACDVFVHNNISLKVVWPQPMVPRRCVAIHHGCYRPFGRRRPFREVVKVKFAQLLAHNISCSEFVKRQLGVGGAVIANCYDHELFTHYGASDRRKELIFVGRLVSDKGCDVLLQAVSVLHRRGLTPRLAVVGDGPEKSLLLAQANGLGIARFVEFVGYRPPTEIAALLNHHQILVVPSVWEEPFGIVALEGAACGCVVVGSNGGGLPEAIGPCGVTFPNGRADALADVLADFITHPEKQAQYRAAAPAHLAKHTADKVARKYLDYFEGVVATASGTRS